ncbi:hypothetical protein [Bifidobacterium cuniculi]|uniref:hypothetical protein n=1 Tax=Bifidobacterium cuniculi TaxID=1688 RepID=UPI000AD0F4C6|nr:hypothetical protein [Bifidobacterium cuniculi]
MGNDSAQVSSDVQNANQAFDGDPTYVSGTWCRNDGKCITISAQSNAIDGDLLLDAADMGEENPLPSGKTVIPMGYCYQSPPPLSIVDNQIRMTTQWSFLDASGTVQEGKYAFGSTPNFVEEPLFLTCVSPYNTEEVEDLDPSNPPKQQDYIFLQPYNMQARSAVSDDTVFYRVS